jgi:hypothetical protein
MGSIEIRADAADGGNGGNGVSKRRKRSYGENREFSVGSVAWLPFVSISVLPVTLRYRGYQAAARNSMPGASARRNASIVSAAFGIGCPFDAQLWS